MAWDASFKNLLKHFLTSSTTEVITETEVPTVNLRIDFIIKRQEPLIPPFHVSNSPLIIGEFKSERDRFNISELFKSIAKTYLFATSNPINDISLFYLIGSTSTIPKEIQKRYDIENIRPGIYRLQHDVEIYLVLLNEMSFTKENNFLGLFAGGQNRYKTIKEALSLKQNFLVSIAYFLYKEEVQQVSKAENIEIDPISLSIKSAVESIGLSKVIEEVGFSRVIEEIGLAKVIEEVGLSKVIEEVGLSKVIEEVGLSKVIEEVGLEQLVESLSEKDKLKLKELLLR
jgi:hypothetical protein